MVRFPQVLFHSTVRCDPANSHALDTLIKLAAVKFCKLEYGLQAIQKNKKPHDRDMVKFTYSMWRKSYKWNDKLKEASDFLIMQEMLES